MSITNPTRTALDAVSALLVTGTRVIHSSMLDKAPKDVDIGTITSPVLGRHPADYVMVSWDSQHKGWAYAMFLKILSPEEEAMYALAKLGG